MNTRKCRCKKEFSRKFSKSTLEVSFLYSQRGILVHFLIQNLMLTAKPRRPSTTVVDCSQLVMVSSPDVASQPARREWRRQLYCHSYKQCRCKKLGAVKLATMLAQDRLITVIVLLIPVKSKSNPYSQKDFQVRASDPKPSSTNPANDFQKER